MSDVEDILAQVVPLGDQPTPQELALAEAVIEHIATREEDQP
jgi:hypothetical protein